MKKHMLVTALVLLGLSASSHAILFPTSGGSYTANVAHQFGRDTNGALIQLTTATGTLGGSAATHLGSPANVIDSSFSLWQVIGMDDSNDTLTAAISLERNYDLNKIRTQYNFNFGTPSSATYELRLSLDNLNWTTVVPRTAVTSVQHDNTFSPTNAKYIQWQVWGPGVFSDPFYLISETELMAFVAAGTTGPVPDTGSGFNFAHIGTTLSETGWFTSAGHIAALAIDNNLHTEAIPIVDGATATFDLGGLHEMSVLRLSMQRSWANAIVEVSPDQSTWYTARSGFFSTGTTEFSAPLSRYIRLTVFDRNGNGNLGELQVFVPEPSALTLLGLAALLGVRRWRNGIA